LISSFSLTVAVLLSAGCASGVEAVQGSVAMAEAEIFSLGRR
jgi:hypothetical protein